MTAGLLLAASGSEPAKGAPIGDVLWGTGVATALTALVIWVAMSHRSGRIAWLGRAAGFSERVSGLPGWAALPSAITGGSLMIAVFGFYWDVAKHIDTGRDPGPFGTAAHYPILIGLFGIALGRLHRDRARHRRERAHLGAHRRRLARAARRAPDLPLRRLRPLGLPARRRLAHALRPGRDALGADARADGGRRLAGHARRVGAAGRGTAGGGRPGRAVEAVPARAHGDGRRLLPDRAVHPAGRVRLRRPAVPARLPADPPDDRRGHRPGGRAHPHRALRRAAGGRFLPGHPRPADADRSAPGSAPPRCTSRSTSPRRSSSSSPPRASRATGRSRSAPSPAC